jgi:hypothetical protein
MSLLCALRQHHLAVRIPEVPFTAQEAALNDLEKRLLDSRGTLQVASRAG